MIFGNVWQLTYVPESCQASRTRIGLHFEEVMISSTFFLASNNSSFLVTFPPGLSIGDLTCEYTLIGLPLLLRKGTLRAVKQAALGIE